MIKGNTIAASTRAAPRWSRSRQRLLTFVLRVSLKGPPFFWDGPLRPQRHPPIDTLVSHRMITTTGLGSAIPNSATRLRTRYQ